MLANIAAFEIRYVLRNPLLWVTTLVAFALLLATASVPQMDFAADGGLRPNAAFATLRIYLVASVLAMFVTTSFVANVVLRDDETGFGPIVRSTPITKRDYLLGRFLGAFSIAALCMVVVPLARILGPMMPWAEAAQSGGTRLADHLYAYFLFALPNLFIHAAVFFALATITRSMMATYLGVISFLFGFLVLQGSFVERPELRAVIAMLDPFGSRALADVTRYWTVAERNVRLPELAGFLLYNRLLWLGIAAACLALAYAAYRFTDRGMSKRERKQQNLAEGSRPLQAAALPTPQHGSAATRALLWMRTRFEIRQVVLSPTFAILMLAGLYLTSFVLLTQRDPDGKPSYPTTLSLIPEIQDAFAMIPVLIAIYYAGELVWRERDRRVHELIDAAPMPNGAYVVPKTLAMAAVLLSALLTTVVASILVQLSLGYRELELGKYLFWYVAPATWDMLLLATLAVFVHAISPHKAVGWGVMVLFLLSRQLNGVLNHNLLKYGGTPEVPLSDLNGAGTFWIGAWTFRLYWGAFAVLLLLAAHLLWRRGTDVRLRPRLAYARRRLGSAAGWVGIAASLAFVTTGAYAYYNTNILNHYTTPAAAMESAAAFEKKYGKYLDLPQPTIVDMKLDVALYPRELRAVTKGRYTLRNLTTKPIAEIHVRVLNEDLQIIRSTIGGAREVLNDPKYRYRIYRLDRAMQPGEERVLDCETLLWVRGFRNGSPNTSLIGNGTYLDEAELMPVIGMNFAGLLGNPAARRKYGLPEAPPIPKLEDLAATAKPNMGRGWAKVDVTVSTSADQTPIAPGNKVADFRRGGWRIARFVSGAPVHPRFAVQSARYVEKHRRHGGIDLAVYYHPAHHWNVDRMLDAMAAALDYYQANFGPYQFDHVRIVESSAYHGAAASFAGTIAYSEEVGFVSDYTKPETMDYVTFLTAHEVAHQWWAHQVIGAEMEGVQVLSETLAQYSAQMVLKHLRGADHMRRYMQFELDRYLQGRAAAPRQEPVLARVAGQEYVTYRKGALAMYLLQVRMGEDAIDRALRTLVTRYKFQRAPYPRSVDLIEALRAEAKTREEQDLITDLFERITLYDLKVTTPTAVRRADGKWNVSVPIEAKKLYADGEGAETEARLEERIEVGLFTAEPGRDVFDANDVVLMERRPIHSGRQVLQFVTEEKPAYAGIDPYNVYIDRNSSDNAVEVH
ncbi:MAG TPA: M1 family aminopeptidase [Thermoanaerobaculia bacterium]|jgi:hypothetical protein